MAIGAPWVGTAVQGNVAGSNVTTIAPSVAGATDGEVCFIFLTLGDAETGAVTAPSGWTTLGEMSEGTSGGSSSRTIVYWKVKQSGDSTVTITGSGWTVTTKPQAVAVSWPGVDPITPTEQFTWGAAHTSGTSYVTGTATPTDVNRWAVGVLSSRGSTASVAWTSDAALTERVGVINTSSIFVGLEVADSNGAVTQASHSYTATGQSASHGLGAVFFLIPATKTALPSETASWTATTTPKTITLNGALTGDLIAVLYGGDNGVSGQNVTAATVSTTGGSTSSWTEPQENLASTSQPWVSSSWATVTADGTVTASLARTQGTGGEWGGFALLLHGYGGIGNTARIGPGSTKTISLTTSAGSTVALIGIDWTNAAVVAFSPGGANIVEATATTNVTNYAAYWLNVSAGTASYGVPTSATTNIHFIAIEILAPAAAAAPVVAYANPGKTWTRQFRHRQILPLSPVAAAAAVSGDASLTVTASITAAGTVSSDASPLAVTDSITAAGCATGSASVATTASITATGNMAAAGNAAATTTATIAAAGAASAGASVAATATITAAGNVATSSGASLAITASIVASSNPVAGASLAITDSITATGNLAASGSATRATTASITTAGTATGSASVATTASITASGNLAASGSATLAVTATITAASSPSAPASLTTTTTIAATGAVALSTGATLAVTATTTTAGNRGSGATSSVTATITAAGQLGTSQGASQPVTVTLTATGAASYQKTANLVMAATIAAAGIAAAPPAAGSATGAVGAVATAVAGTAPVAGSSAGAAPAASALPGSGSAATASGGSTTAPTSTPPGG